MISKAYSWVGHKRLAAYRAMFFRMAGVAVFILVWWAVAASGVTQLVPSPKETVTSLIVNLYAGELAHDFFSTVYRTLYAFFIALVLGVPLGVLLGSNLTVYRSSEALIDFFRSTPATALFPLSLVIFGIGDVASIAVAAFAAWLVIVFNSASGVLQSKETRKNAAKVMGASKTRLLRDVLFLDSLPQTFVGLRVAISLCLVVIVVAEMFIGAINGIGKRIVDAQIIYDLPLMYAAILLGGILGYALNMVFILVEKRVIHWQGK